MWEGGVNPSLATPLSGLATAETSGVLAFGPGTRAESQPDLRGLLLRVRCAGCR